MWEYLWAGSATTKWLYHLNWNSNDSSWNSYNWTDNNISYVDGRFWQCASFNGSSSIINLSNAAWFSWNQARTIIARIKPSSMPHTNWLYNIFSNWANSSGQDFSFILYDSNSSGWLANQTVFYIRRYQNDQASIDIRDTINTTNWRMVAITYNWVSSGTATLGAWLRFYLNGVEIERNPSTDYRNNQSFSTAQSNVSIGGTNMYGGYFLWLIDEVITEARERTAIEMQKYYTFAKGRFGIL